MTVNRGIAPPDFETPVGAFRVLLGDVSFVPLDPVEQGYGSYNLFSDAEIEVFLTHSDGSEVGAAYFAYLQLAGEAAQEAKMVKDFDLQVDLTKRSSELRQVAREFKDRWDSLEVDIFEVSFPSQGCTCVGEASPIPVCRGYCGR